MTFRKGSKAYVLMHKHQVIGVWTNLKQLCEDQKKGKDFVSYSKLSKMDKSKGELKFTTKEKQDFAIIIKVVQ